MWNWLILLAVVVFLMYMWNSGWVQKSSGSTGGGCGACSKNNPVIE